MPGATGGVEGLRGGEEGLRCCVWCSAWGGRFRVRGGVRLKTRKAQSNSLEICQEVAPKRPAFTPEKRLVEENGKEESHEEEEDEGEDVAEELGFGRWFVWMTYRLIGTCCLLHPFVSILILLGLPQVSSFCVFGGCM